MNWVCCDISPQCKNPRLGRRPEGEDIPPLTTLGELKEGVPHFFVWVLL